ncbi:MAG: ABC transporter ATP-binding protein [Eubacterium sp.]|nr:ABC transporter ATP-binding protein [Eubacterium sp.]
MSHLLEFQHVSYSYHSVGGETLALSDISFALETGEFLAVVGPSGCGKSTLLNLTCHLAEPEQGKILYQGAVLTKEAVRSIGYMLQKDHLFHWRSIEKNIYLGLEIQKKLTPQTKEYAAHLLQKYGLYDFRKKKPSELSGGMRQRAALIRTLVLSPTLLLLDEPFSALDYQTRLNTANDIGSIIRGEQKSAVLVTHDLSEAVSLADRILVLSPRPGEVKRMIATSFPKDMTALQRRGTDAFKDYFNMIWKEMNEDEESTYCAGTIS